MIFSQILDELSCTVRSTCELPAFIRAPVQSETALELVRQRLSQREASFLTVLKQAIFDYPRSPYLKLLQAVSCEYGDLERLVKRDGVESTLDTLADEGVYLTLDEFKGRIPIRRGGKEFRFSDADFDNPLVKPNFILWTGGTRNPSMAIRVGLGFSTDMTINTAAGLEANGLSEHRHAYWLLSTALTLSLRQVKLGRSPLAWFYPIRPIPWKGRLGTRCLVWLTTLCGCPLVAPAFMDLERPDQMVDWLVARGREGHSVLLTCYASSVVRICCAALDRGIELSNVCFLTVGEPYTEAKQDFVQRAGARAVSHYGFTEAGLIGYGCGNPVAPDEVHLFDDCYGLIQKTREVGALSETVDAFLFTSLLPTAPKILLNVEPGDHGVVETRNCGCPLGEAGLGRHLSYLRSYEKLTGEGMTFVKSDLLRVIEDVIPSQFGGTPADYQVVEEEDADGITRLNLLVSPRVGAVDEEKLRSTFLSELSRDKGPSTSTAATWEKAKTVRIKRTDPMSTKAGKILPFHLLKQR
jgi:hypothetical protein